MWLVRALDKRSQGKFLYAAKALQYLEHGHLQVDDIPTLSPGMDGFYLESFERRFTLAHRDYETVRRVLGALAVAREPVPHTLLARVLRLDAEVVWATHRQIPEFIRLRGEDVLALDHFSLTEWLTQRTADGSARKHAFAVDAAASVEAWRAWALQEVALGTAHSWPYLLRHLPALLADDEERQRVWGTLLCEHFEWLQARLDQDKVDAVLDDVGKVAGHPAQPLVAALLRQGAHTLRLYPAQLLVQVLGRAGPATDESGALVTVGGPGRSRLTGIRETVRRHAQLLLARAGAWVVRARSGSSAPPATDDQRRPGTQPPDPLLALAPLASSAQRWLDDPAHRDQARGLLVPARRSMALRRANVAAFQVKGAWSLAALPDGRLAVGTGDGTVRILDPTHPQQETVFPCAPRGVAGLAVLRDGCLAAAAGDGTVHRLDPVRGSQAVIFKRAEGSSRMLSLRREEGYGLVSLADGRVAGGTRDGKVHLIDPVRPGRSVACVVGHEAMRVTVFAQLPDGRLVLRCGEEPGWRLLDPAAPERCTSVRHGNHAIEHVAVLHDGRLAVVSKLDGRVRLTHPEDPDGGITVPATGESPLQENVEFRVAVLPDGRLVAGAHEGSIEIIDPAHPTFPPVAVGNQGNAVSMLAVLADGRIATCAPYGFVQLWDLAEPAGTLTREPHAAFVRRIALLGNDGVATVPGRGSVWIWDPSRPCARPKLLLGSARHLVTLASGRLAMAGYDGRVRLWHPLDPASREAALDWPNQRITDLAALSDGRLAALSDRALWVRAPNDEGGFWFEGACSGYRLTPLPKGRLAVTDDHGIRIWGNGKWLRDLATVARNRRRRPWIRSVAGLPDGAVAAGLDDGTIQVWPAAHDEPTILQGHAGEVITVLALEDRLVSGGTDGTVRLWQTAPPGGNRVIRQHRDMITVLTVAPDGQLASGSADGSVQLGPADPLAPVRQFVGDAAVSALAVTRSGVIVVGCDGGAVHFLRPGAT
jgi:WD40 repeat protein